MPMYREGQTATDHKTGETVVFHGGQWVSAATPGSPVRRALSVQDQKTLNDMNSSAAKALEVTRQEQQARAPLQRLHPGPFTGAMLQAAIPDEGGGFWDKVGAAVLGGPAKALGVLTPQTESDYQNVMRVQRQRVLEEQTRQKGVQTEGDAARIAQSTISPYKTMDVNDAAITSDTQKAQRDITRANFYANWAQKYGLNGVDEHGRNVESAFQAQIPAAAPAPTPGGGSGGWSLVGVK